VKALNSVHEARLLSYQKPAKKRLGLPPNLNVKRKNDGIRRMVNRL
jgi:hypothetical protein